MQNTQLAKLINDALEDLKGQDITVLDVTSLSNVMDTLIIVTGTSNRHVKSLANNVVVDTKANGHQPIGVEGLDGGEWVLVDYGDTVVHIMLQQTRDFYELEKLWSTAPAGRQTP
ncbi:ribosome silencing factor [Saccharophagus degradans]|uniref:Ribosomal silencing factor RsfS n=2 Tax=Saccharophagus degradans TaxID=86304 RepID=Q21FD1_SACD2|nr:ribosome silencing factor [Saccharophagus degradans]ABD82598.1 Iojap-related protein [Saccharophagus degradans 2-40]MBU2987003.1 ribosome silencing factor [Saccharophagus degradans]MDO6424407.1 ribosome silencing factor [Saccharophagus degradans]MDO6608386.1 ribosome silencing factor [Saccharophagus degradans]WGO99221.1 ribosome silencing factor [Saccharophagus degradans]